jgi:NAD(P)H-dependent flavin oxidoreductase YrpB (nitropropane dioxygenase family)
VDDVVVTREIDGLPAARGAQRAGAPARDHGRLGGLALALRSALALRRETGASLRELLAAGFAMRRHERLTRTQMVMAANAPILARTAMTDGDPVHGYLPSGTVAGAIDDVPTCAELVERIVAEAERTLASLARS